MKGDYTAAADQHREVIRIQRKAWAIGTPPSPLPWSASVSRSCRTGTSPVRKPHTKRPSASGAKSMAKSIRGCRRAFITSRRRCKPRGTFQAPRRCIGRPSPWSASSRAKSTVMSELCSRISLTLWHSRRGSRRPCRSSKRPPCCFAAWPAVITRCWRGRSNATVRRSLTREGPRDALPLLDECVAINQARYGTRHPAMATALATSARARAALGEHAEAEKLFREALAVQRQVRRTPHVTTVEILTDLGESLRGSGPGGRGGTASAGGSEPGPDVAAARPLAPRQGRERAWRLPVAVGRPHRGGTVPARTGYARLRKALGDGHPATGRARARLDATREGRPAASH